MSDFDFSPATDEADEAEAIKHALGISLEDAKSATHDISSMGGKAASLDAMKKRMSQDPEAMNKGKSAESTSDVASQNISEKTKNAVKRDE